MGKVWQISEVWSPRFLSCQDSGSEAGQETQSQSAEEEETI